MPVFNLPINNVSFGQVSIGLLKEAFFRKQSGPIFPIGKGDLAHDNFKESFQSWLNHCLRQTHTQEDTSGKFSVNKNDTTIRLWHLNPESYNALTNHQRLISFYELDSPTRLEVDISKRQEKLFLTSEYTCEVFRAAGCDNVEYVPLFFDSHNFHTTDKTYNKDDSIAFNIVGKFEKRKHHHKILKSWVRKFGDNKKYRLNCAVYNPHLPQENNNALIASALEGKKYFNVNFLPHMPHNREYNDFLNSADIVIGMSGGEGWGLPEFHSVALGAHAVILNCNGYKSWANKDNATLVEPTDKIPAEDGVFFKSSGNTNQGNIFDFNEDDFISACEESIKKVESNRINTNGQKLQEQFTVSKTFDKLFE